MKLQSILISLVLGLAGTTLVAAETQPPIIVLDSTELDLSERSAAKQTLEFFIPAKFMVDGVDIRRWSIAQGGKVVDPTGSKIDFREVPGQKRALVAAFNLTNLNTVGAYVVTIEFFAPEPPKTANAPDQKVDTQVTPPKKELEQTVQLKLTRPAAELRVSTPLQLSNTVYFLGETHLEPNKITLNEVGGKSSVSIDPATWKIDLRHGSDPIEAHRLSVQLPKLIDGFDQATATVKLDGPIALGTTSGTLTVRSAQLAAQTMDFAITVVTRVAAFWLLPVIVVGIVIGWYFRNRLEARGARLEAVIPAEQEVAALQVLIDKTVDPKFKRDFETEKATLVRAIEAKRGTVDNIRSATTAAAGRREAIAKEMADLANKLRVDLDSWSRLTAVSEPLPDDTVPVLTRLRTTVQSLAKQLEGNLISGVDANLKRTLPDQKDELSRTLGDWLDNIDELKARKPKTWPETRLAAVLQTVAGEAERLRQTLGAADTPDKFWQVLLNMAHLLRNVQEQLFRRVLDDARTTAEAVSKAIVARDPKLQPKADAIRDAAGALPDRSVASTPTAADRFVTQLDALWAVVASGLQAAWNDETTVMTGLADGRFLDALAALAKKPKPGATEQELGDEVIRASATPINDLRADLQRTTATPVGPSPMQWKILLQASDATVSEAVVVRALPISLDGRDPPRVTLRWYQDGSLVGETEPGTLARVFRFSEPGPVLVQVTADAGGESASAKLTIQVLAPHGASVIELEEVAYARAVCLQNLISAAIILWAGWLIFSPTFVGTMAEFAAAFLWGFSVDIGAAKVRELTDTVKALKPAIPIPKT